MTGSPRTSPFMTEAKYLADEYKEVYNQTQPRGSLGGLTPNQYWETVTAYPI